jgi:hypothetical protein
VSNNVVALALVAERRRIHSHVIREAMPPRMAGLFVRTAYGDVFIVDYRLARPEFVVVLDIVARANLAGRRVTTVYWGDLVAPSALRQRTE